ncbi:MAG: PEP-CTERM sorting domain-containing protein [Armatimonadota bacterium]|nr:PEP-CTERM sorting domain-containing protein [Armatimonadota bacterium]
MKMVLRLATMLALAGICFGGAWAQEFVPPSCEFVSFDPQTYEYVYKVTCYENQTIPFGQLIVRAEVPNTGIYKPWVGSGPVNHPEVSWRFWIQTRQWVPRKDNAIWTANSLEDVIPDHTAWVGYFHLIVPNSYLTEGIAVTMDGMAPGTEWTVYVPGPAMLIPEPSSILALFGLTGGLLPILRRRK